MKISQLYDDIGTDYARSRRADPRIEALITKALGPACSVLNVGAGTGSYEPSDRDVIAVEPSFTMIRQRRAHSAPAVCASALDLPFADAAFAASMAVLTIHHWPDWKRGIAEMRRVSRDRVVLLTWDPELTDFWLIADYFPEIGENDRRSVPTMAELQTTLGAARITPVPIPSDCRDGFLGAYWQRPAAYLEPGVRSAISAFGKLAGIDRALNALRADLASGAWQARHAALLERSELDIGYRLVVAEGLAR